MIFSEIFSFFQNSSFLDLTWEIPVSETNIFDCLADKASYITFMPYKDSDQLGHLSMFNELLRTLLSLHHPLETAFLHIILF